MQIHILVLCFKEAIVDYLRMYGIDFEEFLWGMGISEDMIGNLCGYLESKTVIPEERMDGLIGYALKKSTDTLTEIFEGRAAVSPAKLRSDSDRCKTCANRSVCGFDEKLPGCKRRSLGTLSDKAFFERIGAAEKNGDNGKEGGNGD